ncbi:MAG: hypothetical protein ACJAWV_000927 [Flammeovirgaceae bacterium]|jgi:hypothetical protein
MKQVMLFLAIKAQADACVIGSALFVYDYHFAIF